MSKIIIYIYATDVSRKNINSSQEVAVSRNKKKQGTVIIDIDLFPTI